MPNCGHLAQISVGGAGPVFCNCDYGMCLDQPERLVVEPGEPFEVDWPWDQRIFFGPSDTLEQPGAEVGEGRYIGRTNKRSRRT